MPLPEPPEDALLDAHSTLTSHPRAPMHAPPPPDAPPGQSARGLAEISALTSTGAPLPADQLPSLVPTSDAEKPRVLLERAPWEKGVLTPRFASFTAPGAVVLQAAEPLLPPRIAQVRSEEGLSVAAAAAGGLGGGGGGGGLHADAAVLLRALCMCVPSLGCRLA